VVSCTVLLVQVWSEQNTGNYCERDDRKCSKRGSGGTVGSLMWIIANSAIVV